MIDPQLEGRVALVTGANHGIGAATARALAAQGVKVFITFWRPLHPYSEEELEAARAACVGGDALYRAQQSRTAGEVVAAIRAQGGAAEAWEVDLSDPACIPKLFDRCERKLGSVEILVNNATHCALDTFDPAIAQGSEGSVAQVTAANHDATFAVNSRAVVLLMTEYLQRHLARGADWGRIVNISTDAAHAHVANVSYAASKHAVESFSRSAAAELGRYGVTVNIVAPGPIQTGYITPEMETMIVPGTPLGRLGEPEDVADVIVFLTSEQARWLTGQLLYVGGGWRMGQ